MIFVRFLLCAIQYVSSFIDACLFLSPWKTLYLLIFCFCKQCLSDQGQVVCNLLDLLAGSIFIFSGKSFLQETVLMSSDREHKSDAETGYDCKLGYSKPEKL